MRSSLKSITPSSSAYLVYKHRAIIEPCPICFYIHKFKVRELGIEEYGSKVHYHHSDYDQLWLGDQMTVLIHYGICFEHCPYQVDFKQQSKEFSIIGRFNYMAKAPFEDYGGRMKQASLFFKDALDHMFHDYKQPKEGMARLDNHQEELKGTWIIGAPGSGKTTLVNALNAKKPGSAIDLDELGYTTGVGWIVPERAFKYALRHHQFVVGVCSNWEKLAEISEPVVLKTDKIRLRYVLTKRNHELGRPWSDVEQTIKFQQTLEMRFMHYEEK